MPPLPPLPPAEEVLPLLQQDILPGAGVAALVMCLFLVPGRWAGALGSAAAVVLAFGCANFKFTKLSWEDTWRLLPWKPEADMPGWNWLARAALVLVAVGLVSRWVGMVAARYLPERLWWGSNVLVWAPRAAAVVLVSRWLTAGPAAAEWTLLWPQLALAMLLTWVALDGLARNEDGGGEVPLYLTALFFAAGTILVYSHNMRFLEIAAILGGAAFGIAIVAGAAKADASGAVPAGAAMLPGLVLGARPSLVESNVPAVCFWLVALAPALLLPFVLPAVHRRNGWGLAVLRCVLLLAPLAIAVALAMQYEKLPYEE